MRLLDRHVLRGFLVNYAVLAFVLLGLFLLIDFIVDLDEFLQAGRRLGAGVDRYGRRVGDGAGWLGGGFFGIAAATLWSIVDFYTPLLLLIFVFFSGPIAVGAVGFAFTGLQRSRELLAMLAAGVSLPRAALPVLIAGAILTLGTLPVQEFVLPEMASKLTRSKSDLKKGAAKQDPLVYLPDGQGRLWSALSYDLTSGVLEGVRVVERDGAGRLERVVTADQAVWVAAGAASGRGSASRSPTTADGTGPELGRWELIGGVGERPVHEGRPPTTEAVDHLESPLSPKVLLARRGALLPAVLSLRDLQALQDNPAIDRERRRVLQRTLWARFSLAVLNVLLLLLALPYFLTPLPPGGMKPALQAAAVCLGTWASGILTLQVSPAALPPAVSAWLPVVLTLPVAAAMLTRIRS